MSFNPLSNGGSFLGNTASSIADAGNALAAAQLSSVNKNLRAQQASAERAMRHAAQEAEKNRQWQERMANTQYQRAMADMKKAGLNPILAYQQGGNAVPNGSSAGGYTINGAQGQISGWQAAMMAAPQLLDVVQRIATNGFQAVDNSYQKWLIADKAQKSVSQVIDMVAGVQK